MKHLLRVLFLVFVAACGRSKGTECKGARIAHVELHRIDEDSGPSKELAAKAGFDHGGLHADLDAWTGDDPTSRHLDFYATAPDRVELEKFVVAAGAPPADHEWLYGTGQTGWRTYYAEKQILLDQTDFTSVKQLADSHTGRHLLDVKLTDVGQHKFAVATRASIGHKLATVIDGTVVTAPIVNGAIEGGRFEITFDSTASSDALVNKLCR